MKTVTDYAGNEIKEGDEFCIVKIIDRQRFLLSGTEQRLDKPCWEIGKYHKVIVLEETMNEVGYFVEIGMKDGYTATCYNTISIMKVMDMDDTVILAIKGISDTKQYYDKWKEQQNITPMSGRNGSRPLMK